MSIQSISFVVHQSADETEKFDLNIKDNVIKKTQQILEYSLILRKNIYNIYLSSNNKSYLLRAFVSAEEKLHEIAVYSFLGTQIGAQKLEGAPKNYDDFLATLKSFEPIIEDSIIEHNQEADRVKKTIRIEGKIEDTDKNIPSKIKIKGRVFYFTKNFKRGLSGERGDEHLVDLHLVTKGLESTINKSIKSQQRDIDPKMAYHFRVSDQKILTIVIYTRDEQGGHKFSINSAYYRTYMAFQRALNLINRDTLFAESLKNCALLTD